MLYLKKGIRVTNSLFLLMVLSIMGVFYFSFKDLFLKEEQQFELAQQADFNKEYKKAEKYYLLAGRAKNNKNIQMLSYYYLGLLYKRKDTTALQNFKKSEEYLIKSAELGLKQAQYELALLYDTGDKIKEDRINALFWMEKAAEQNFAEAQHALAVWTERGYYGKVDMPKAVMLYEKAANQGYKPAQKGLALIYKLGVEGVAPDKEKADFWLKKVLKNK